MWKWAKNIEFKILLLFFKEIKYLQSKIDNLNKKTFIFFIYFHNYFSLDNLFLSNLKIANCTRIFFFLIWFTWKLSKKYYSLSLHITLSSIYIYIYISTIHTSKKMNIRISTGFGIGINDLRWKQGSKFHSWIDPNSGTSILWSSAKRNASSVYALASGHADCVAKPALPKNGITGERRRTMEARFLVAEETHTQKKKKRKKREKIHKSDSTIFAFSTCSTHVRNVYNNSFIDSKIP